MSCLTFINGIYADALHPELDVCYKLMNEGKFEEARERINQFRRSNPANPLALFYFAQLEDDTALALSLYKDVELRAAHPVDSEPDSSLAARAVFARAEIIFSIGNLSGARNLCERIITTYPTSDSFSNAYYKLGIICLALDSPREALTNFRMCTEIVSDPSGRLLASVGIMECYVKLKDWNNVLRAAREVLEENDEESSVTPRVLEIIARAWQELGNEENAALYNDRLLKNYPNSFQAYTIREKGKQLATDLGYSFERSDSAIDSANTKSTVLYSIEDSNDSQPEEQSQSIAPTSTFSIQASAFKERMNAYKMFMNLKQAGYDKARVQMKTVRDEHFYIVLVGSFRTREEAEKVIPGVIKVTGEKANVVFID